MSRHRARLTLRSDEPRELPADLRRKISSTSTRRVNANDVNLVDLIKQSHTCLEDLKEKLIVTNLNFLFGLQAVEQTNMQFKSLKADLQTQAELLVTTEGMLRSRLYPAHREETIAFAESELNKAINDFRTHIQKEPSSSLSSQSQEMRSQSRGFDALYCDMMQKASALRQLKYPLSFIQNANGLMFDPSVQLEEPMEEEAMEVPEQQPIEAPEQQLHAEEEEEANVEMEAVSQPSLSEGASQEGASQEGGTSGAVGTGGAFDDDNAEEELLLDYEDEEEEEENVAPVTIQDVEDVANREAPEHVPTPIPAPAIPVDRPASLPSSVSEQKLHITKFNNVDPMTSRLYLQEPFYTLRDLLYKSRLSATTAQKNCPGNI